MKKSSLIAIMLLMYVGLNAQQDAQFTQWMFDKVSFNPAANGMTGDHCITLFYRDQWDMFDRDPKTSMVTYNGLFADKIGAGVAFSGDRLGQEQNTMIKLSGAYHHQIGGMKLSGGLSFGSYAKTLGDDWRPNQQGDAIIPDDKQTASAFDLGFGAMVYNDDFYGGISLTHLTQADLSDLNIEVVRHMYIMGGYNYAIPNSDLLLRTNALAKTDLNSSIFDINANVLWNEMIWAGVSWRPGDAVAPMAGFMYNLPSKNGQTFNYEHKVLIGYSYDTTLSPIKNHSAGSHEVFVTYCFNYTPIVIRKPYSNPRFIHNKIN